MSNKYRKIRRPSDSEIIKIRTEKNGLGALKTLFVGILILLQLSFFVHLYLYLIQAFKWIMIISFVLGILSSIFVLSSSRNSVSKAVWVFLILVLSDVGIVLYILSDERVFFCRSKRRFKKVFEHAEGQRAESPAVVPEDVRAQEDCAYLKNLGGFAAYSATDYKYYPSGGLYFDDVLESLSKAQKFVFIESFIVADGVLLDRILEVLSNRIKDGVEVRLIYDDMGCHRLLSHKAKKRITDCGIQLLVYNRLIPVFNVGLNIRDHRKIIVIDGKTAYTGGVNIADEYINESRMYGYWKDAGVRVEGPAVDGFTFLFLRQWEFISKHSEQYLPYFNHYTASDNTSVAMPYSCGPEFDDTVSRDTYLNILNKAHGKLYIMTPYLVPDDVIMETIANKAQAGCDVRMILPGIPDKPYVYAVTLDNARRLAASGVKVYTMTDSFVHSKIMLCDYCAVVGSINMDMRSFYQQFESALYTDDKGLMASIEADFEKTFTLSDEVKKNGKLKSRLFAGLLRIVSPLM